MKLQSYDSMLLIYRISELEREDKISRDEILLTRPYSVIVEGGYMEFDNMDKWIEKNYGPDQLERMFYDKFGYDYCCCEYFFRTESQAKEVTRVVPRIYTKFPNDSTAKSDGYWSFIEYDPRDIDAIVFEAGN